MSDAVTEVTQTPEQQVEQAEADFSAGFDAVQAKASPEATPEKTEPAAEETAAPAKTDADATAETAKATEAEKPLIAGYTEEQLKAALGKGAAWETEVRKAFSKIGELNRTIQDISKALAAGKTTRKITAEQLKRVNEELPGLGDALAADLSDVLGSAEVAQAQAEEQAKEQGKPFDQDAFFKEKVAPLLEEVRAGANRNAEERLLRYAHPDYMTVIYADPKEGRWTPEFETWVKTLPAERQGQIQNSEDAIQVAGFVTEFKDWSQKQKKDKERNKTRLESAITPKGAAQQGGPVIKDDEALFNDGFNAAGKRYAR